MNSERLEAATHARKHPGAQCHAFHVRTPIRAYTPPRHRHLLILFSQIQTAQGRNSAQISAGRPRNVGTTAPSAIPGFARKAHELTQQHGGTGYILRAYDGRRALQWHVIHAGCQRVRSGGGSNFGTSVLGALSGPSYSTTTNNSTYCCFTACGATQRMRKAAGALLVQGWK